MNINGLLLTLVLLTFSSITTAADWSQANLSIINKFAIPSYQTLQKSADQLIKSSHSFCATINDDNFKALKSNFHRTMDAWQTVQILRSGPAMENMRSYRLEMWPDRSNAATKHLRKLQKEADPASLKAEKFAKASTAIQGLSAMERVLYAKGVKVADFSTDNKANFKCHLLQAMSLNIQTISNELLHAWQHDYRDLLTQPSKENAVFETDKSVSAQFLNDLNTQLQVVLTQKFKRPLDHNRLRLTRAESWRSQRSLRNIALNISASKQLYDIGFASQISDKKMLKKQQSLFDQAIEQAKLLEMPMKIAHAEHLEKLQQWIKAISALKSSINSELPVAIDIPLGFNSLDGD
ncbi:MAG: imelysin family protein [Cocleimonas sp.]|nr:imelysin family protein [Cocleimonas sp.]